MHPLDDLEFTTRVAKRAQYEAFEFALTPHGVRVRNGSHADPSEHEYLVTVANGHPVDCSCPAEERFEGACKHRVAVAIRRPVLDAANALAIAADGGTVARTDGEQAEEASGSATPADEETDCDCEGLRDDFPCWECVRTGRRDMPE